MEMFDIFAQRPPQRALAKEDHLAQAFFLHRSDPALLSLLEISVTAVGWGASGSMQPKRLDAHSDGADRQPPGRR